MKTLNGIVSVWILKIEFDSVGSKSFEVSGKYNINSHIVTLTTERGERGSTVFGWH